MVEAGAMKATGSAVDQGGVVDEIKKASVQPEEEPAKLQAGPAAADEMVETQEEPSEKECERLSAIKEICVKLEGLSCSHMSQIKQRLAASAAMDSLENPECELKDGRCQDDVLPENCPILAMAKCNSRYNNCSKTGCSEFTKMATCPFIDKKAFARCDYGYRLYHSDTPNTVKNNVEDKVCGEYTKLPVNVKSCINAKKVPDSRTIKLTNQPLISRTRSNRTVVSSYGFGVRFREIDKVPVPNAETGQSEIKEVPKHKDNHKGLDLHGNGLIYSVAKGKITDAHESTNGGWTIRIKHVNGENGPGSEKTFDAIYRHMSYPPVCNQKYVKGETIGLKYFPGPMLKACYNGTVIYSAPVQGYNAPPQRYNVVLESNDIVDPKKVTTAKQIPFPSFEKRMFGAPWAPEIFKDEIVISEKNDKTKTWVYLHFMCVWVPFMPNVSTTESPVEAGEVIGFEAGTGKVYPLRYGSHLHFEMLTDKMSHINPYNVLDESVPSPRDRLYLYNRLGS